MAVAQKLRLKYVRADLLDEWIFDKSITHVLQLVADGSQNAYSQNALSDFIKFSQRLIQWCEKMPSKPVVVHASSGACFGYFPLFADLKNSKPWEKANFVVGRLKVEQLLQGAHSSQIVDLRVARLFSFIGSHIRKKTQYAVASFISMAQESKTINLMGDPMTVRSYLSAHDMSTWIMAALQSRVGMPILSIGSSVPVTMIELAQFIAETHGAKVVSDKSPLVGDIYVADNAETKAILGVDETITWKKAILELGE